MEKRIKISVIVIIIFLFIGIFLLLNKKEIASKPTENNIATNNNIVANIKKPIDTSAWTNYKNNQLGFSMKIPLEVPTLYRCDNKQAGNTPLKTYEDNQNGVVYISAEYYYDANWSQPEQKFIGGCDKITYSLKSLENRENTDGLYIVSSQKPFLGWKIIIKDVDNNDDILKYIKENFGSGCIINNETLQEDGAKEFSIVGNDLSDPTDDWRKCNVDFSYKIRYYPEKHKLMSVVLGQECTFGTNPSIPSTYQCYDNEMINSFKFE